MIRATFVTAFLMTLALTTAASAHTYTHTIEKRGDVESDVDTFRRIADETLSSPRGWTLNLNLGFTEVSDGEDFRLILASPEEVEDAHSACSRKWSCRGGDQVLINDERWQNGTSTWPKSLRAYRSYVINHEVGHWLGLRHVDCPGDGEPAPVMMQQSKGLEGCKARVWPLFGERRSVANQHGVSGWPTPPKNAPAP